MDCELYIFSLTVLYCSEKMGDKRQQYCSEKMGDNSSPSAEHGMVNTVVLTTVRPGGRCNVCRLCYVLCH
jgi:hypothetical protein